MQRPAERPPEQRIEFQQQPSVTPQLPPQDTLSRGYAPSSYEAPPTDYGEREWLSTRPELELDFAVAPESYRTPATHSPPLGRLEKAMWRMVEGDAQEPPTLLIERPSAPPPAMLPVPTLSYAANNFTPARAYAPDNFTPARRYAPAMVRSPSAHSPWPRSTVAPREREVRHAPILNTQVVKPVSPPVRGPDGTYMMVRL